MSNNIDDHWHVRIPRRLQASVERIAIDEDRHPAQVVRRLLHVMDGLAMDVMDGRWTCDGRAMDGGGRL
jgi:hypothetical protein